jgi:hypothetical protein
MKTTMLTGATLAALLISTTARADQATTTTTDDDEAAEPAPLEAQPAPQPLPQPTTHKYERGHFSGKRMVVEILSGALVGTLAGLGVYSAAGGEGIGATFAGLGAEIVVTPIAVWGTGKAMGGRGTLGATYLGGLAAFAGPSATPQEATLSLAIGMTLMPVTSALFYEISSHVRSKKLEAVASGLAIAPVIEHGHATGVQAGLSLSW